MIFLWPTSPAEMGISKGTLYYHYPTKDDLILDIMEKHMDELSKGLRRMARPPRNDDDQQAALPRCHFL
jgi:AcrR family transcriptional regulator